MQILLYDIPEDAAVTASVEISSAEARTIDIVIEGNVASHDENAAHLCWQPTPRAADEVSSILASVSPILDDQVAPIWTSRCMSRSGKVQGVDRIY